MGPLAAYEGAKTVVETSELETTEKVLRFFLNFLPRFFEMPFLALTARLAL